MKQVPAAALAAFMLFTDGASLPPSPSVYTGTFSIDLVSGWITHSNDDFTDDGSPPTHWMPRPE